MLASQLANTSYPNLQLNDTVAAALQLMEDYDVQHLPVTGNHKLLGLVAKEDLLDVALTDVLAVLQAQLIQTSILADEHFTAALKQIHRHQLSLVPVVNNQSEVQGVITHYRLVEQLAHFNGTEEPGGILVLEMDRRHFSFGEIARLVETNDAFITQLNTYTEPETGLLLVTLKLNKNEISDVLATFQRYEYTVRYHFGEEQFANEIQENYQQLMNYLSI
jgi:acetoin utilization protein AcuB